MSATRKKIDKQETQVQPSSILSLNDLQLDQKTKKNLSVGFSIWIRSLMQNWRQGTVACKGRSDVAKANRKPWKQKGTGRARAGSARSPLWRGGGVTFGPQPRVRTLMVPRKVKNGVLNTMLFSFIENGRVRLLDWSELQKPQTSAAFKSLKNVDLHDKKITLLLPFDDYITYASFANLKNVSIKFFDQVNAYDLANSDYWVLLNKDVNNFKEMAKKWI